MATGFGSSTFCLGANFVPRLTVEQQASMRTLARRAMFGGGPDWSKGRNLHDAIEAGDHKTARFHAAQLGWKG